MGKGGETDLAVEWDEMMLAHSVDLNVLHNDHLIMPLMEQSSIDDILHILLVSLCVEQHRQRVSLRRIQNSLSVGVLAYTFQQCADRTRHLAQTLRLALGTLLNSKTFAGSSRGP